MVDSPVHTLWFSSIGTEGLKLPIALAPGWNLDCTVECAPTELGVFEAMITFQFDSFSIGRLIRIRCGNVMLHNLLQPSQPYSRPNGRTVSLYDVYPPLLLFAYLIIRQGM